MSIKGAEGLVDSVVSYLQSNFTAKLTAVEARYATDLELPTVANWLIDDPLFGSVPSVLPTVWVLSPRVTLDQYDTSYAYQTIDLVLWGLVREQDAQKLHRACYRYSLALWETLLAGSVDGTLNWTVLGSPVIDFSEILTNDNVMYKDFKLMVDMSTLEQT